VGVGPDEALQAAEGWERYFAGRTQLPNTTRSARRPAVAGVA